jgi:preprotein translocase SecE subunit
MHHQKYIIMSFLGTALLIGFAVRGLAVPLLALLEIGDPQILGLVNATALVGILSAFGTFIFLNRHPVVYSFTEESIIELSKVVWPDKEETIRSTLVVCAVTFVFSFSLAVYDFVWARITGVFLFSEG